MEQILKSISSFLWGAPVLILLAAVGLLFGFRTKFFQFRKFGYILKNTAGEMFKKGGGAKGKEGTLTPLQAVCSALAGCVGTANIAGVATAMVVGGPGAVFWMWVVALLGMLTKCVEVTLGQYYRIKGEDGVYYGGPMYYIERGLHMKWLACIFAILGGLATFGIGNATQAAEISVAVNNLTGTGYDSSLITGIVLMVLVGIVILGGLHRISTVTSYLVPFMALFYIVIGLGVILGNAAMIPGAFGQIFSGAFSFEAVGGGVFGYVILQAMKNGFARGVFSNEAGLGSAPIAHAASSTKDPVKQGMWGVFEVFVDTIVVCTITALVVILSGLYTGTLTGGALTAKAVETLTGSVWGGHFIRVALILFALSTILGWEYYGETCWGYLTKNNKVVQYVFKAIFLIVLGIGAISSSTSILEDTSGLSLMWSIADTLNGLMAIPNLVGLLLLSGVTVKLTKRYFKTGSSLEP